ncbi:DUF1922 domain-containing protein [Methanoplanus sp. FWC-SCC4]|uniref:DUF1922 domain-containing protein n=1 Tax=Methanochimaera problematica TaxID=2609417 RepID=A0AA97FDC7_9EURY|nr:DUF1922 domain-containing protein [Methanoplanus sp. FWC-SCC4]WOF15953.1 DUF1922 domain-containing protein [Methanoplanus sp. FWC-SCC4]
MYLIVRCPGCASFTYVDRYQKHRLCPVCSEVINVRRSEIYLDVGKYQQAESIVKELEKYLHKNKKNDLSQEELKTLRKEYAGWMRKNPPL